MNVLTLERDDQGKSGHGLRILVDGVDIVERVAAVEIVAALIDDQPDLAGSYAAPLLWRIPDLRAHLLGRPNALSLSDGYVDLLVCGDCGVAECWAFELRIDADNDIVVWHDYRQRRRPEWQYDGLPRFEFDRAQYEAAITAMIEQGWNGPDES